jgi:hypothetical protein
MLEEKVTSNIQLKFDCDAKSETGGNGDVMGVTVRYRPGCDNKNRKSIVCNASVRPGSHSTSVPGFSGMEPNNKRNRGSSRDRDVKDER